jgi:hypothetical protein
LAEGMGLDSLGLKAVPEQLVRAVLELVGAHVQIAKSDAFKARPALIEGQKVNGLSLTCVVGRAVGIDGRR